MKKLYRSDDNKIFLGILGGLGEYWDLDPAIIRLGFVLMFFVAGVFPLLIGYFVAYFIIPSR